MADITARGMKLGPQKKKKTFYSEFISQIDLQLMVIPSIIFIFIFSYIPMYGILMAFQEFQMGDFPGFSKWEGFRQFELLFRDPNFPVMMRNTIVISLLKLAICFPAPIILSIMLNEITNASFKKSVQTISYLPHFISWVVGATLLFDFFSPDNGGANYILVSLGLLDKPIFFFGKGEYFWGMLVVTDIWKELGWNAIIYIAAITSIDAELYEAADIDGAGRFSKIWYITIASILPTIILLFIFTVGGLLNANFDQIMMLTNQMGNPSLREFADVIDTYVFRAMRTQGDFSTATAIGLIQSVLGFIVVMIMNKVARKWDDSMGLF